MASSTSKSTGAAGDSRSVQAHVEPHDFLLSLLCPKDAA
ncbi:hypothetical protein EKH55_5601 (plasmid) [Sinorhizobium alkalisoli]|nr:hypothetical protein EKH55_5601 [Sinorhizobium alkalisoli]